MLVNSYNPDKAFYKTFWVVFPLLYTKEKRLDRHIRQAETIISNFIDTLFFKKNKIYEMVQFPPSGEQNVGLKIIVFWNMMIMNWWSVTDDYNKTRRHSSLWFSLQQQGCGKLDHTK